MKLPFTYDVRTSLLDLSEIKWRLYLETRCFQILGEDTNANSSEKETADYPKYNLGSLAEESTKCFYQRR